MRPQPKVLLLDDDPAIGRLVRVLLGGERYQVLWRRRGDEGLAEAAASRPDAVILELDLPDTDGLTVLAARLRVLLRGETPPAAGRSSPRGRCGSIPGPAR